MSIQTGYLPGPHTESAAVERLDSMGVCTRRNELAAGQPWRSTDTLRKRWHEGKFPPPLNPESKPHLWDARVVEAWVEHADTSRCDNYDHWKRSEYGKRLLAQAAADYAAEKGAKR
jgi:hypothetical protein